MRVGRFFGFLNITMTAPEKVRQKYDAVNFPPLFKKYMPKKEDLSEKMQEFFDKNPTNQLTVGYECKEMTLSSSLVQFYIREGFIVEKIHWCIEYQRGTGLSCIHFDANDLYRLFASKWMQFKMILFSKTNGRFY